MGGRRREYWVRVQEWTKEGTVDHQPVEWSTSKESPQTELQQFLMDSTDTDDPPTVGSSI